MLAFRRRLLLEGKALTLAAASILSEPAGLAFDARDMSASVKGHTTNFDGDANGLFTYSSPSTKYVRNAAGLLVPGTTMRCDHDALGNKLGLLIEEQRTNLLLRSNEFDNAAWSKANSTIGNPTVTANQGIDPGGDVLADRVDFPAVGGAGNFSIVTQSITATAATHTGSVYVKALSAGDVGKKLWAYLNNNGTIVATQAVTLTADYQMLVPSGAFTAGGARTFSIGVIGSTFGGENQAAVSVLLAYAQLEVGAFATSYIATAGSTVTRVADDISLAVTAFPWNQALGMAWAVFDIVALKGGASDQDVLSVGDDGRLIEIPASGNVRTFDGANIVNSGQTITANTRFGAAVSFSGSALKISGKGAAAVSGTFDGGMVPAGGILRLGRRIGGTYLCGHLRSFGIVPRAANSDAELQAKSA